MNSLFRWRAFPVLRPVVGLMTGMLGGALIREGSSFLLGAWWILWILSAILHRSKKLRLQRFCGFCIWGSMICFGAVITPEIPGVDSAGSLPEWTKLKGYGIVSNISPPVSGRCRIELDFQDHQDPVESMAVYKALIQSNEYCGVFPGDTMIISGSARNMFLKELHGQGFTQFLLRRGIEISIYPDSIQVKERIGSMPWRHRLAYHFRRLWAREMLAYIPGNAGEFLVSLCLGYRIVESDIKEAFQRSGAMHILAISGLHVGIAAGIFRWATTRVFPNNPWGHFFTRLISQISLWTFVGISGSSEPAVRAAIMLTVWDWGKFIHRGTHWVQLVSLSVMIQLVLDPSAIFQAGFQFSYAAVVSILLFSPWIRLAIRWLPPFLKWPGGILLVSLAAQLGVGGLTIYHFGQFPLLFLVTNLVALPAATFFMISGWILLILSWIMPVVAYWISPLLEHALLLFLQVIRTLSEWSPEGADQIYLGIEGLCLFYGFLATWIIWLYQRRNWLLFTAFVLLQVNIIGFIRKNEKIYQSPSVTLFENAREKVTAISYRDTTLIMGYTESDIEIPYEARSQLTFHKTRHWIHVTDANYIFRDDQGNQMVISLDLLPDNLELGDQTILIPWKRQPSEVLLPSWVCQCEGLIVPEYDREYWKDRLAVCREVPHIRSVRKVGHFCTVFENQLL